MTETQSDELDATVLVHEFNEHLKAANGSLSATDKLIIMGLSSVLTMMIPLQKKVNKLEDTNIIIWIKRNKVIFSTILTVVILAVMFFHEISPWVISRLAIIANIP